jgi:hypothetical protein
MQTAFFNVMAHVQKPDFVFRRNGRVHLNRPGHQFSRLLAADVCASAVVTLDTPCSEVVWRVLATHSIRQFSLHFPSRVPLRFNWTSPRFGILKSLPKYKILIKYQSCHIYIAVLVSDLEVVASISTSCKDHCPAHINHTDRFEIQYVYGFSLRQSNFDQLESKKSLLIRELLVPNLLASVTQ